MASASLALDPATGAAFSRAGRSISWESHGTGPGLVVLHGAARAAHHYRELAKVLAPHFTVHLVDRNGRGRSMPARPADGMAGQIDDVRTVFAATGARFLFGHSAGGLVALEAAREIQPLGVAVYDAGLSIDASFPREVMRQFASDLERGDLAGAQAHLAKAVGALPGWLPHVVSKNLFRLLLSRPGGDELRHLLPTALPDLSMILALDGPAARFSDIRLPALVLRGARSPNFLSEAARRLASALPQGLGEALSGQGHNAPDLTGVSKVAHRLIRFFSEGR